LPALAASRALAASPRPHSAQNSHSIAQNTQHTKKNMIAPIPTAELSIITITRLLFTFIIDPSPLCDPE
jgi:hypothetical protein